MRFALCCLILVSAGCEKAPPPDTREADAKTIKDLETVWAMAATNKNLDAFVAYYTDDASVLMPNAPIWNGKQAIKDGLKPMMNDPNYSLTLKDPRVEVAKSGDMAFSQGAYEMTFSDTKGNKFSDEGKYLTVWRKMPGGSWKAVEDTACSDLPLPPPPGN